MDYLQIQGLLNQEVAVILYNSNPTTPAARAMMFNIFDPNDLSTIYVNQFNIEVMPISAAPSDSNNFQRIYIIGRSDSKLHLFFMNYDPNTRDMSNAKTRILNEASPSSKSKLKVFDDLFYGVIGGTGFGASNSHENAAIIKYKRSLIDVDS